MKNLIASLAALLLSACVAAPIEFAPQTVQGAQCKAQCAQSANQCTGRFKCAEIQNTCTKSCMDVDTLASKK